MNVAKSTKKMSYRRKEILVDWMVKKQDYKLLKDIYNNWRGHYPKHLRDKIDSLAVLGKLSDNF